VRITQSRLPSAWPSRAQEIAKLTALQTEFADFAAELAREPRLPRYLLEADQEENEIPDSRVVAELLERWELRPSEEEENGYEAAEPDQLLDGDSVRSKEREQALRKAKRRRREELRRYLERTGDVPDLRRDLFYLQSAGLDVGLPNPELAEMIEAEATDSPERVIEMLAGREQVELEGAARLLAAMVGDVVGPEQARVMSCLMATVEELGETMSPAVARVVAGALNTFWRGYGLAEEHLFGALRTAIAVRSFDPDVIGELLRDERLWEDPELVAKIVPLTPDLRDQEVARLRGGVIRNLSGDSDSLLGGYGELAAEQRLRLIGSEEVFFDALGELLDREAEERKAEGEAEEEQA
jgi:hypothetical protein